MRSDDTDAVIGVDQRCRAVLFAHDGAAPRFNWTIGSSCAVLRLQRGHVSITTDVLRGVAELSEHLGGEHRPNPG
ncbi:hypothetical protein [Dactylosporangium matsuzakiense]|uniref:Uncharacterized protein n=1 Tax=Dactylosporangium matsuzakiense TaxID=53360 RepID=A0A9W6KU22_9ACTN|nr:hypothetical protein [Dactylosporangium matsuzakiense]UWZ47795.1 hypothetical protein Dmats_16160 [Dactylosporangium matsuzakiense]GLL07658.1 hypothetical protein GCM10017581_094120 [Dactylosporangium matsuzakiense]